MEHESQVSLMVVSKIATEKGVDVIDLPPIYQSIDPDALDKIVSQPGISVHFSYAGFDIEVTSESTDEVSITVRGANQLRSKKLNKLN